MRVSISVFVSKRNVLFLCNMRNFVICVVLNILFLNHILFTIIYTSSDSLIAMLFLLCVADNTTSIRFQSRGNRSDRNMIVLTFHIVFLAFDVRRTHAINADVATA